MPPIAGVPDPALSQHATGRALVDVTERRRFERDGFVAIDRPVIAPDELAEVRAILDELLGRVDELPSSQVNDLGCGDPTAGHILEVVRATEAAPQLRDTAGFRRCRRLAGELLGVPVAPYFDHVICKAPRNRSATAWHQDTAYGDGPFPATAHVWLALQDVDVTDGCMQFLPGSHRSAFAHRPRGGDPTATALEAIGVDASEAVACPLPAGGLTVHHPGTLHHTGPNDGDRPRLAWILQFRDEGSWGLRALLPRPVRGLVHRHRSSR